MPSGIKKRMKRIQASGVSKADAKQLAKKRAKTYQSRVKATGLKNPGKKGSLKRAVFRHGDKEDVARLKATKKAKKVKTVKSNARKMTRVRGGSNSLNKVSELRRVSNSMAKANATPKASMQNAMRTLKNDQLKKGSAKYRAGNAFDAIIRGAAGFAHGTSSGGSGRQVKR